MYGSVITSWKKTPDGYAVCPATSPENMFLDHGEKTSIGLYTENTLAIIRNLFRDYLEACDALKRESDAAGADSVSASTATAYSNSAAVFPDAVLSQSVREILPKIVPTKIGSKGQILEWNEEFEERATSPAFIASVRVPSGTGNHEPDAGALQRGKKRA